MSTKETTSNNPVYAGRLRQFGRGTPFIHAPAQRAQASVSKPQKRRTMSTAAAPSSPRLGRSQVLQRNITAAPKIRKHKVRKLGAQKMLMAMATFVFLAGSGVAFLGFRTNKEVKGQVRAAVTKVQESAEEQPVDEAAPTAAAIRSYNVNPSLPRYIRIPKLKVNARVQRQGIDKSGALKAPGNVHDAGWYENSSKPGEAGAVLLDGHVAGPTTRGVFYAVTKLAVGDVMEIERGDGKKFSYKVTKTKTVKVGSVDMSDMLLSDVAGKPGLNLITCTGTYDTKSGEYDSRAMVFAVQI